MDAGYIQNIVKNIDSLPYRAIMFDGKWGIGKSYAVEKALGDRENVCRISVFGMQSADQIYHEALFQLGLKNERSRKAVSVADKIFRSLETVSEGVAFTKDILNNFISEREIFLTLTEKFKEYHIIVIDDIERLGKSIEMEELLGVIDELKRCRYIKLILIANTGEIQGENRDIFEKYKEKVIDRIYNVTDLSENVEWGKLNIRDDFITAFLNHHKVNNLRTLQKAQSFYEDVLLYCSDITDEEFLDELRLVCFAVVVEDIEKLYGRKRTLQKEENINDRKAENADEEEFPDGRLRFYEEINRGRQLFSVLTGYYKSNFMLTAEKMESEYKVFCRSGGTSNYFRSEKEVEEMIEVLRDGTLKAESTDEANRYAAEYVYWGEMIQKDCVIFLEEYRMKIRSLLNRDAENKDIDLIGESFGQFHSEKVKAIYREEVELVRKTALKMYIDYLKSNVKGSKAHDYSYRLKSAYNRKRNETGNNNVLSELTECLYNRKFFPADALDESAYYTCQNIMYILYHQDRKRFLGYVEKLSVSCDRMAHRRIRDIIRELNKTAADKDRF